MGLGQGAAAGPVSGVQTSALALPQEVWKHPHTARVLGRRPQGEGEMLAVGLSGPCALPAALGADCQRLLLLSRYLRDVDDTTLMAESKEKLKSFFRRRVKELA